MPIVHRGIADPDRVSRPARGRTRHAGRPQRRHGRRRIRAPRGGPVVTHPQICILHIPRTAGTSLRRFVIEAVGRDQVFWHGVDGHLDDVPSARLARYRVIGGHRTYAQVHWGLSDRRNTLPRPGRALMRPPRIYCSVLREPRAQVLSHYRYLAGGGPHAWAADTLAAALAPGAKFARRSQGIQCRYLCGRGSARAAVARIGRGDFLVGTQERLGEFAGVLAELLGARAALTHENASTVRDPAVDAVLSARIDRITSEDARLYAHVDACGLIRPSARGA